MNKFFRLLLPTLLGFALGSAVNMGLIMAGGSLIPPPEGADVKTMEGLQASLHLFEPRHFLMPFLAHALGTGAGALLAAWLATNASRVPAFVVGSVFLMGGIANVLLLPAPVWFNTLDLLLAYLPMAWLAQSLVTRLRRAEGQG